MKIEAVFERNEISLSDEETVNESCDKFVAEEKISCSLFRKNAAPGIDKN